MTLHVCGESGCSLLLGWGNKDWDKNNNIIIPIFD